MYSFCNLSILYIAILQIHYNIIRIIALCHITKYSVIASLMITYSIDLLYHTFLTNLFELLGL
jgi:hypothetical protein